MIELCISEINEYNEYILLDEKTEQVYFLCLEFDKILPEVGDKIILPKILLNRFSPVYAQPYAFGEIDELSFSKDEQIYKNERACLIKNGHKIYLKRVFG